MPWSLRLLGLVFTVLATACAPGSNAADYGAKVAFQKDTPITFPDFSLTYVGERHVASDRYPRGFNFQDFKIVATQGAQTVSWSSGTGDIGPSPFQVGSKHFALELARADKLGPLKSNELVITRAP